MLSYSLSFERKKDGKSWLDINKRSRKECFQLKGFFFFNPRELAQELLDE
jgi:hypothetical protein